MDFVGSTADRAHAASAAYEQQLTRASALAERLAACGDGTAPIALPLRLDLLPTLLQCFVSMKTGIEHHVAYLSLERLCLQALGCESVVPRERYDDLVEFEMLLHALYGPSCSHMMHGQGQAHDEAASGQMEGSAPDACNAASFLVYRNSGHHHPDTLRRKLPAIDLYGGPQFHALLNFWVDAIARASAVTFSPAEGLGVTLVDVGMDGLMLGAGATVDEHALKIVGLRRRVGFEEAQRVLGMSDAELAAWHKENPAMTSAVRVSPSFHWLRSLPSSYALTLTPRVSDSHASHLSVGSLSTCSPAPTTS